MSMKEFVGSKLSIGQAIAAFLVLVPALLATGGYIKDVEELKRTVVVQAAHIAETQRDAKQIELHLAAIQAQLEMIKDKLDNYESKPRDYRQRKAVDSK